VDTGQYQAEVKGCEEEFSIPHTSVNVVIYFLERSAYRLYVRIKLDTVIVKHSCVTAKLLCMFMVMTMIIHT
jgi:hypothetical protein